MTEHPERPSRSRPTPCRWLPALAACAALLPGPATAAALSLIPWPAQIETSASHFRLSAGAVISVPAHDPPARFAAEALHDRLASLPNLETRVTSDPTAGASPEVRFVRDPAIPGGDEAYRLAITASGVEIRAHGDAGLYYGAMTLWQVATSSGAHGGADLPGTVIDDAPRFRWRGLLLDSARHYQSPDFIRRLIDKASTLKLNVLQWHLTDDQAWRLEIKRYPRLARVGGCRHDAGQSSRHAYCGVYSQAEVRGLVAYAAQRDVRIVPEIDIPGHASAAVAAYPELASSLPAPREPENRWGVFRAVYNPSPAALEILNGVLDEVADLFPSPFVHIGGDEVVTAQWKASAAIQARMRDLGVADETGLRRWFAAAATRRLAGRGRRAIGWDELLEGGAPEDTAIMSWRGTTGADTASAAGHDVVLSPAPFLYLDNRQDDLPDEPPGRGHVSRLSDIYRFDPAPKTFTPEQAAHVLGVQGNVWTEHLRLEPTVERAVFPRAAALAEIAWSPQDRRPLEDFEQRLLGQFERLRAQNAVFSATWFQPRASVTRLDGGHVRLSLSKPATLGKLRYRLGGGPVGPDSPEATAPLDLALPVRIAMGVFDGDRLVSPMVSRTITEGSLRTAGNHDLALCSRTLDLNLEGRHSQARTGRGLRLDILNPCWIWKGARLDGVRSIAASIEPLPFNYGLGAGFPDDPNANVQKLAPPSTAHGELEVRRGTCDGSVIARLPLGPARRPQHLSGRLTAAEVGLHDLCLHFTGRRPDPMWAPMRLHLAKAGSRD